MVFGAVFGDKVGCRFELAVMSGVAEESTQKGELVYGIQYERRASFISTMLTKQFTSFYHLEYVSWCTDSN